MLAPYIIIAVSLIYFLYTYLVSPLAKLPGPRYTIFTSLPLKYHEFTASRRTWIHELHKKYGPVVRLGPNEVSFASLEAKQEIYSSGGAGYDRTEFYDLFQQFGTRTLFSTPPKGPHSARKRIFADRYANTNVMRPEMIQALQGRAEKFLQNCLETENGDPDVYIQLHCFALDGASHFLFAPDGTDSLGNETDYAIMEEQTYHDSLKENLIEYYTPALSNLLNKFNILAARPSPLANDYVLSCASAPSSTPTDSLIATLVSKSSQLESTMSAPAECMDHLAAGIDTTGDGLTFLMHALSLPESGGVQTRLRAEISENADAAFDRLPYLDAVVREGLRCFPPIPMSFPRCVPVGGRRLDGWWVPQGTIVSCQPWTIHRDEGIFPEAEKFKPERWVEASKEQRAEMDRMFFAFSQGGRGCIGKNLAMAEMKLLLREVYAQCKTTISKKMKGDMSLADQIISSRPRGQTCRLAFERV